MLTNFEIFNNQAYTTATQIIQQEVEKFNAASNGTMILVPKKNVGDFDIKASFGSLANLIRERNPYADGAINEEHLKHLIEASVKCPRGTPPVRIDQQMFSYIQQNPKVGGAVYAKQLSVAMMQDMINTAILAARSAITGVSVDVANSGLIDPITDITGDANKNISPRALNRATRPFGDKGSRIAAWVMHSTTMYDYMDDNLANAESLYVIGDVTVMRDPLGRIFVVSDSPSLVEADTPANGGDTFNTLGLVPGAVRVEDNGDFYQNLDETNGNENIKRTIQSEWTFNVGVKNTEWDRENGGKTPNVAALGTATNWDTNAHDTKVTAGVILKTKAVA